MAGELACFARELEEQGAAQLGGSFTPDPEDDALIQGDPNAFLFGVLFTQGIPAERAWAGPARLRERLGTLDPAWLAVNPASVREAVQAPPMLHRFKETLPRWIVSASTRLVDEYACDASRIWLPGSQVLDVVQRLGAFEGIGRKKAVMAAEILIRHFRVGLEGREHGTVAYDVQVRRVFLRSGLVDMDSRTAMESAATEFNPIAPGMLDLPAWLVGRQWCRPRNPRCAECRLGAVCPRLVERDAAGVGAGRDRAVGRISGPTG